MRLPHAKMSAGQGSGRWVTLQTSVRSSGAAPLASSRRHTCATSPTAGCRCEPASKGPWYLVISCSQAGIAMSGTSTLSSGSRRSGNLRNARTQMHLAWQPAVVRMRLLRLQHRFKVLLKSACSPWLWSTGPWRMRRKMSFAAIRQPSLRTRWAGLPRQGLPSATLSVRTHVWWGGLTNIERGRPQSGFRTRAPLYWKLNGFVFIYPASQGSPM